MVDTYCSMMSLVAAPAHSVYETLPLLQPVELLCNTLTAAAADDADDDSI